MKETKQAGGEDALPEQLILEALMRTLELDGCAASLWNGAADRIALGSTNEDLLRFAELNFTLWEGPGPDAVTTGSMVASSDVTQEHRRWPMLLSQLGETSIRTIVVVPLRVETNDPSAVPFGLMSAARTRPAPFNIDELSVIVRIANALSAVAAWRVDKKAGFRQEFMFPHSEIYDAIEKVKADLSVSGPDALACLRAKAFVDGVTLRDFAIRVLDGELQPASSWLNDA